MCLVICNLILEVGLLIENKESCLFVFDSVFLIFVLNKLFFFRVKRFEAI